MKKRIGTSGRWQENLNPGKVNSLLQYFLNFFILTNSKIPQKKAQVEWIEDFWPTFRIFAL
jgi:hypothetical protein